MLFPPDTFGRLRSVLSPLVAFAWRLVLVLTLSRILLVAWQWRRVTDVDMLAPVFLQGLRFDLVLLGLSLVIPVLLFPLLVWNERLTPIWRGFLRIYLPAMLCAVVFMELGTPSFISQFDFRPNILFVEYLNHPREVLATLWGADTSTLLFTVLFVAGFAIASARKLSPIVARTRPTGMPAALLKLIGVAAQHPMIGHDLTRPEAEREPGRAIMQYSSTQAYMADDRAVVLQKDLPARQFVYREGRLVPAQEEDDALVQQAQAHAAWSSLAHEKALYRLPAETNETASAREIVKRHADQSSGPRL